MRVEEKLDFGNVVGVKVGYAPIGKPLISVIFYHLDGLLIDTGSYNTRPSLQRFVQAFTWISNLSNIRKYIGIPIYYRSIRLGRRICPVSSGYSSDITTHYDRLVGGGLCSDLSGKG